jgi:acetylornithine deacetylase/succinyl-diaminopimelate desuccinylase-like protein
MSASTPDASVPLDPARLDELRRAVTRELPGVRRDLEALVRIPSISVGDADQSFVQSSAEAVATLLREAGLDTEIVVEGGRPAVIGRLAGPDGAPTVMLYAHHDVQPVGEVAEWTSPPFEPQERDGRLFGRGAADDKAGVMAHLAAIRAHDGHPPVSVVVFVEGEEEDGSRSLSSILERHRERLSADVLVLADSLNWAIGQPALTTSLRGLVECFLDVSTLDHTVHSGMFGGAVPDAVMVLTRLLATMHDERGVVIVPGLRSAGPAVVDYPEDQLRLDAGLLDGVELIGTGSLSDRIWNHPTVTVTGIDLPSTGQASNTLQAHVRAKLSVRVAPGQPAAEVFEAVRSHLLRAAPWGAHVEVTLKETGEAFAAEADGPAYDAARSAFADAWGVEPVDVGVGGSIPFIAEFAEHFPKAAILVTGVEDPDTRAHGIDESLHLGEFERVCVAEAVLLERIGALNL